MRDELDRQQEIERQVKAKADREEAGKSKILKQNLPRPVKYVGQEAESEAGKMIETEMQNLVVSENRKYPFRGV